ncbi:Leucine-rich repeat protein soc-2 homolog, partial [Gryllus bimaculatus]
MSFFRRKENTVDYKARLENKLYLARVSPESDFDLSDCNLKAVPSGIFALIKVFRKEALFLQQNQLTSLVGGGKIEDLNLLQILDIHSNCLLKLPDEIVTLTSLKELNVSTNKLTHLPENIGEMTNLRILNVSNNNLKNIPSSIGRLQFLRVLDLQLNKKLLRLPSSLCHAVSLAELHVDKTNFEYPPKDVIEGGTSAVMQFLCSEEGVEYVLPKLVPSEASESERDGKWAQFKETDDGFQEQKQRERLALEQGIFEQQRKELELQNAMKNNKEKLLEDLAEQQSHLENEILRVQQEREAERLHLMCEIQQVEAAADNLITQLLASCSLKDSLQIQTLLEQESREEEQLLASCQEEYQSLIRKDVLSAMENILEEEAQREAKIREYERGRAESTRTILNQNEELQRAAVATLLERSDARSWGLTQHLRLVQEQLATLTALEMKRRHLQISEQVEDLSLKRTALSELLVDLLAQQAARRKQLLETLHALERQRAEEEQQRAYDFWLVQYQRLLDLRSANLSELECSLDPLLAQHLLREGVVHCLPLLTQWVLNPSMLEQLSHEKLIQAGISSCETRESILKAVHFYLEEHQQRVGKLSEEASKQEQPTAPAQSDVELVSNFGGAECVVCMDKEVL